MYSPHFQAYNRNKRSLVCDLKQPADRELFERLIARSATSTSRISGPGTAEQARRRRERLRDAQPAARVLLDQRLRRERSVRRAAQLRLGGAGAVRDS